MDFYFSLKSAHLNYSYAHVLPIQFGISNYIYFAGNEKIANDSSQIEYLKNLPVK